MAKLLRSVMAKDEAVRVSARMEELEAILEEKEEIPVLLHPNMGHRYQKEVQALISSLNDSEHRHEAADLIRGLVNKIVLTPKEGKKGLWVDWHGDLAGILTLATGKEKSQREKNELIHQVKSFFDTEDKPAVNVQDLLVAGAGFEPAAFRL